MIHSTLVSRKSLKDSFHSFEFILYHHVDQIYSEFKNSKILSTEFSKSTYAIRYFVLFSSVLFYFDDNHTKKNNFKFVFANKDSQYRNWRFSYQRKKMFKNQPWAHIYKFLPKPSPATINVTNHHIETPL